MTNIPHKHLFQHMTFLGVDVIFLEPLFKHSTNRWSKWSQYEAHKLQEKQDNIGYIILAGHKTSGGM